MQRQPEAIRVSPSLRAIGIRNGSGFRLGITANIPGLWRRRQRPQRHPSHASTSASRLIALVIALRDWRVRKAITKAINRDALVDRLMDGVAVAAGQIASPGMFGHDPNLKPEPFDPDGAKKLLAAAGYADGFRLTLHSPNDRYVNDAKTAEALGAMLTRIGIKVEVVAQPWQVFAGQQMGGGERGVPAYSATLYGFGTATGETMSQHWMLLHTVNKERALGHANVGEYSNIRLDAYLDEAMRTMDAGRREKMLWDIGRGYMNDVAVVPLFWQVNAWATRKGFTYEPRIMNVTQAMSVHAAK